MLISAYMRFRRRFSLAVAWSSVIIDASTLGTSLWDTLPCSACHQTSHAIYKSCIAHAMFVAKFRDWYATLRLLQYPHNLRIALSFILHSKKFFRYYAKKILLLNITNFQGNYRSCTKKNAKILCLPQRAECCCLRLFYLIYHHKVLPEIISSFMKLGSNVRLLAKTGSPMHRIRRPNTWP